MEDNDPANLKSEVLRKSLAQVKSGVNSPSSPSPDIEPCVICLERLSEEAVAKPCGHHNFDFLCLASWLEQQRSCPLCKATVHSVKYRDPEGKDQIFDVQAELGKRNQAPSQTQGENVRNLYRHHRSRQQYHHRRRRAPSRERVSSDVAVLRRRNVYRHKLYSLHVGSNRVSAYRDLTPQTLSSSPAAVARARMWVRRELQAFSFLHTDDSGSALSANPTISSGYGGTSTPQTLRSASNAEFLLEYIVAIAKTVDLRDSAGQAQELVGEFLGRENAGLFLHELNAWLRSPFESLEAWDRHVQYSEPGIDGIDEGEKRGMGYAGRRVAEGRGRGERKRRFEEEAEDDGGGGRMSQGRRDGGTNRGRAVGREPRYRAQRNGRLDRYVPD